MTDIRVVLDEYQERADSARFYTRLCGCCDAGLTMECTCPPASPRIPLADMIEYSGRMVAALRAVLDTIDGQHEYTCETSWLVGQIRNAITEALGGNGA